MKRKSLLLCLVVFTIQGTMYAQKFKAKNAEGVEIKYEVISTIDKTVQVTRSNSRGELIIPATVEFNGIVYRVTSIKKDAFFNQMLIQHLVLPEGLEEIGLRAFFGSTFESIYIPSTVKLIGKNAFSNNGGWGRGLTRSCKIECLPPFVDVATCEEFGLSKGSVASYWATHGSKDGLAQSTINNEQIVQSQVSPSQTPIQPQNLQESPEVPSSDVDIDIPQVTDVRKNTFAIIIANEDYQDETKVDYAKNDGEVFKNYCNKTLGLPGKNVHFVANATLNNLIGELDWLQQVCDAFGGEANIIFYYAGHGIPDEATSSAYLLPTDGNSRLLRTCFSINELYETLGKLPAKKVTVLMDACFSGAKRDGNMLASARGVAIKAKAGAPKGNMIVLSASQGDETAYKYEEAGHGLFTYFLLKKLKETKGAVTMGELSRYIQEQVKRYSIVENGKIQTPSVQTSDTLKDKWESLRLE